MYSKEEAAKTISLSINTLIAPEHINEGTIVRLEGVVSSLFALLPNPHDEAAQRNMVRHICNCISEINLGPSPKASLKETIYAILMCVQSAHIAAMRGNIPFKNPFEVTIFLNIYLHHCPGIQLKDEEWLTRLELQLLSNNLHHIVLYMWIYNNRLDKLEDVYDEMKEVKTDIHLEAPLAFARAHDKYGAINLIVEKIQPEIFKILARKMISVIRQASSTITAELADLRDEYIVSKVANLIMTLSDRDLIVLDEENFIDEAPRLMLEKESNNIDHFVQLHNYGKYPPPLRQELQCAPTEMDSAVDILHTIMHRLEDTESRKTFFRQTDIEPMSAGLLCTLSCYLSIMLGSHTHDIHFHLNEYVVLHRQVFMPDEIETREFAEWQCRVVNLLNLTQRYEDKPNDPFESRAHQLFEILRGPNADTIKNIARTGIPNAMPPLNLALTENPLQIKFHINFIIELVRHGADINAVDEFGYAPLHLAIIHGHDEAFEFLMAQPGINISIQCGESHTAIWYALKRNNAKQATELFNRGIVMSEEDLHGKNSQGHTLLVLSFRNNIESLSKLLLTKKVDWSQRDANFSTPLHHAAKYSPATTRLILFQHPLSRYALALKNLDGHTPADRATSDPALSRDIQTLKKFYPTKQ